MSRKTRKGIRIGIPHLVEGWYEREIEEFREDVKRRSRKSLFRRSKTERDLTQRFRDFLMMAEKDIELYLWYGKGFAIKKELGKEIDYDFHHLFGRLIGIFNEISLKFDANTLSEDLLNHLKRELKLLQEQAGRLWEIQSCNPTSQGKERAKKLIDDFRRNLIDFSKRMKPYLRQEEAKNE